MRLSRHCFQKLAVATFTTIAFYTNSASAQIIPDATLPNNSRVTPQDKIKVIEGGTQAETNLFHSFEKFSVPTGSTAHFNNSADIQNIITRITGKSISNIDGILRANGTTNLFLINPNGIVFGENASLNIGGSFLATTASSINFADGTKFSATQPETEPLLTINVPIGLQFGATAAPIRNQSQASPGGATNSSIRPVGLQVPTGNTLALIGGDVILEGGNLTADSGRIELGSVAANSLVSLNSIDQGWVLGYEAVENFRNIQVTDRSVNGSEISSSVEVDDLLGGGNIHIRGDLVELIGAHTVNLTNNIDSDGVDTGDLNITARKLVLRDGAQVNSLAFSNSAAGNLTVNASESVEIIGGFTDASGTIFLNSGLGSNTGAIGKAGDITINSNRLLIKDGGLISADSSGIIQTNFQRFVATGEAGNLTINASDSVEVIGSSPNNPSSLRAVTLGPSNAGKLTISTKQLIVRDGAEINVSSRLPEVPPNVKNFDLDASDLGDAGELNITADSILLDNQGNLISETQSGNGGNITLQLQDLLLLRRNSQISTDAGTAELGGNGGNIDINIPDGFIVAIPDENSDITANAFTGSGGKVEINATGIFGIQPRSLDELAELLDTTNPSELNPKDLLTSDITAISQENPNLSGELNINVEDVEPTRELVELPDIPIDTRISQVCRPGKGNQSEFIFTGRGGLPPLPGEALGVGSALDVDWVEGDGESTPVRRFPPLRGVVNPKGETRGQGDKGTRGGFSMQNRRIQNPKSKIQNQVIRNRIVEATGWIVDENGDIFFVAGKANGSRDSSKGVGC